MKYNKQGRYCLGVGKIDEEDNIEGKRLTIFAYTGRRIVGIKAYKELIAAEIKRVKNLPVNLYWCDLPEKDLNLYWYSPLTVLLLVSAPKQKILEAGGFKTLSDLKNLTGECKKALLALKSIGIKSVKQ